MDLAQGQYYQGGAHRGQSDPHLFDPYQNIPYWYERFSSMPDEKIYHDEIALLEQTMTQLSNGYTEQGGGHVYAANQKLDGIKTASDYLSEWYGSAAGRFKEKFLDPFDSVSANHFYLAGTLKWALEAHRAIWKSARKGICDIATATLGALDNDGCNPSGWNITFTVLSSVATIFVSLAAPPAAPGAIAGLLTTLSVAGAVAQSVAVLPPGDDSQTIPHDAAAIVKAMKDKMLQLVTEINDAEGKIVDGLNAMVGEVDKDKFAFQLPRPDLADQDTCELTGDKGLGWHG
jgi:hypothetical protein